MKKIICLILAVLMLASMAACNTTPDVSADESTGEADTVFTGKLDAEPYDGVFKVGYSRQDITPAVPINQNNGTVYKKVLDNLYATCVAINDGENTVLLYTIDTKGLGKGPFEQAVARISKAVGIPCENIMISASHSHTAPMPGVPASDAGNIRWVAKINTALVAAAKEAIADLSDAEIHNGSTEVKGMAFVRRYIYEDGTPGGIWRQPTDKTPVRYESEADNSIQVIRFVREEKKDVVISNLQTHFTEAGKYYTDSISADLADILRNMVEMKDEDALFAVYVGASGNIATDAYVKSSKKFGNYQKMGAAVAEAILNTTLEKVESGKIQVTSKDFVTNVRKEDAETVAKARLASKEIGKLADSNAEAYKICAKYGFECAKEVSSILSREDNYDATRSHIIGAISFGDVAFIAAPYEMFDTNGMEIKEGSPFNMTFVLTNAGGAGAYIPSALAVPNGGYEVYTTVDEFGTAEKFVAEYLNMLREHKGIN